MREFCRHGHNLAEVGASHGHCNACRAAAERRRRRRLREQGVRIKVGRTETALARFEAKVDRGDGSGGCWEWIGAKGADGYGKFAIEGFISAHRAAYTLLVGPIPDGLEIDHLCRNRACVNPDHLEPVSRSENIRRGVAGRTHCRRGHAFTPENTRLGPDGRRCRACQRAAETRRTARRRAAA